MNRNKTPWMVSYQHRPFYCSNSNSFECSSFENSLVRTGYEDMPGLENLFVDHKMDLGFWGHEHSKTFTLNLINLFIFGYERFFPISQRVVYNLTEDPYFNAVAPTYIITGSAGCHSPHAAFDKDPMPGSAARTTDYGYTIMHVLNKTHLFIEQISVENGPKQVNLKALK